MHKPNNIRHFIEKINTDKENIFSIPNTIMKNINFVIKEILRAKGMIKLKFQDLCVFLM